MYLVDRVVAIAGKPAPTKADLLGRRLMLSLDQVHQALGQGRVIFVEVMAAGQLEAFAAAVLQ